jgi:hypothetical protein
MNLTDTKKVYLKLFKLNDDLVLDLVIATVVATKFKTDPIWLMIIGGPSSGKSELVNTVEEVKVKDKKFCYGISTLTENSFMSGMPARKDQETSLLHEIGDKGVIVMKDFTSILSMARDKREAILGQMREIYDGKFEKRTGNGQNASWNGKINWLGAVTDAIYINDEESASMGRRTISYEMPEQSAALRRSLTKSSRQMKHTKVEEREHIKKAFAEFIQARIDDGINELPELPEEFSDNLEELSDFATLARSPVARDFKGSIILVPSPEMPMRMNDQLHQLAQTVLYINDGILKEHHYRLFYKVAFDSIPKQRRMVLHSLAEYEAVSAKGLAQHLNYPTETVKKWLQEANVLKLCDRKPDTASHVDLYTIKKSFRKLMMKYDTIEYKDEMLVDKNGGYATDFDDGDETELKEKQDNAMKAFGF